LFITNKVYHLSLILLCFCRDAFGVNFKQYAIAHAGIGVWDKTEDFKFTMEFVSKDYVGALLPDFHKSSRTLIWNNKAKVVFTSPASKQSWTTSQLICETTGVAYNQLVTFIEDHSAMFSRFQPVEVVYYNESLAQSMATYSSDELEASGYLKVKKQESFWFVEQMLGQLDDYGADIKAFMNVYGASYQYLTSYRGTTASMQVVEWATDGPTNDEVYAWYSDLADCYNTVYLSMQEAEAAGADGSSVFFEVRTVVHFGLALLVFFLFLFFCVEMLLYDSWYLFLGLPVGVVLRKT
jgi:hypothetical protein